MDVSTDAQEHICHWKSQETLPQMWMVNYNISTNHRHNQVYDYKVYFGTIIRKTVKHDKHDVKQTCKTDRQTKQ